MWGYMNLPPGLSQASFTTEGRSHHLPEHHFLTLMLRTVHSQRLEVWNPAANRIYSLLFLHSRNAYYISIM